MISLAETRLLWRVSFENRNSKIVMRTLSLMNRSLIENWTNADLAQAVAGSQTDDGCITAAWFLGTSARAALCTRVNLHRRPPSVFMRINKSLVQRRETVYRPSCVNIDSGCYRPSWNCTTRNLDVWYCHRAVMSLAKCNTDKCRIYEMPQLLYYHARLVVNNLFFFAAFPSAFLHLKRSNHVFVYFREREIMKRKVF